MSTDNATETPQPLIAVGAQVDRGVGRLVPKRAVLAREAVRLAKTFEGRTEVAEDIIDAVGVLQGLVDTLDAYHLDTELAHEASQGAYMQAAWLEECANNNPEASKRRELLRRAWAAKAAGDKLRGVS